MFQRILVPVDLTEKSLMAVDKAREFAAESEARVVLLHVIERIEHLQSEYAELKPFYDRLESKARKGLEEFSELLADSGAQIERVIVYGQRTTEIVDFAVQNDIDLIIMASHRINPDRPGHDWSSISYTVAILSPCPVLLLK